MKKISVGIIGWGFMGRTHAHALRSIPLMYKGAGFEIERSCICTRRADVAAQAMRDAEFLSCTSDWKELLRRGDIDVVSICTPNALHEEMAIFALEQGKHVYLDKPVSVAGESAMRILSAARRSAGCFTRVAFNNRFLPATMRMKQLIDEGRLGKLMHFEARYLHGGSVNPSAPIGWKQQLQGGVLLDLGSHVLDLVTWLLGYPERALCKTRLLYPERPTKDGGTERALAEDHALMLLQMPGGALGTVEASKIATGSNDDLTLEIRGEKGALRFDLMQPNYLEYYDASAPASPMGGMRGFVRIETVGRYPAPGGSFLPPKASLGWERGHTHCYFSFLDAVSRGVRPNCDLEEGVRLQLLMDKLSESARDEKWVGII